MQTLFKVLFIKYMNVLITGSYGQLGSNIRAICQAKSDGNCFFFTDVDTLDICDRTAVARFVDANSIDIVVNCAAYTAVDKAESDAELCSKINVEAVANLVNAAQKRKAKIIHVSTDYVFDGQVYKPYVETDRINPQSVYGSTKAEGESVLMREYAENSLIIRTSWLYSLFGNNFVKTMIRLGKDRGNLSVVFDQVGTPTNAADLAQAIMTVIAYNSFVPGIYHYSNEGVCSWYDFAKAIFDLTSIDCRLLPIESSQYPTPAKRPHYSVLNKGKIKQTYNIAIPHWSDSLRGVIDTLCKA